ncbi:MAG: hypothetical protein H0X66_13625 [Verrucomicrobia bacterium]|nr:hypothetical protein [Verrucomicrobiota bacterium]
MRFATLVVLSALIAVGCGRDAFKDSDYSKPMTEETLKATNGLDPNARIDAHEARPPSEVLGARGSSSDIEIQDPDKALGTNAPPRDN